MTEPLARYLLIGLGVYLLCISFKLTTDQAWGVGLVLAGMYTPGFTIITSPVVEQSEDVASG